MALYLSGEHLNGRFWFIILQEIGFIIKTSAPGRPLHVRPGRPQQEALAAKQRREPGGDRRPDGDLRREGQRHEARSNKAD